MNLKLFKVLLAYVPYTFLCISVTNFQPSPALSGDIVNSQIEVTHEVLHLYRAFSATGDVSNQIHCETVSFFLFCLCFGESM
jgi:hypothetical protein